MKLKKRFKQNIHQSKVWGPNLTNQQIIWYF